MKSYLNLKIVIKTKGRASSKF